MASTPNFFIEEISAVISPVRRLNLVVIALSCICILGAYLGGRADLTVGILLGGATLMVDLFLNTFVVKGLVGKKNLALAFAAIVIKYPVLLGLIYLALKYAGIGWLGFVIGLSLIIPASLILAVWQRV